MTVHYLDPKQMVYTACRELPSTPLRTLETTAVKQEVSCLACRQALLNPVHFAKSPHSLILCRRKTVAMHMGMKSWSSDRSKITCPECRRLLEGENE